MSEKEKNSAKVLVEALKALPDGKREFLLGYAEGVTTMAKQKNVNTADPTPPPDRTG